jgi:ribosomal protein S17E
MIKSFILTLINKSNVDKVHKKLDEKFETDKKILFEMKTMKTTKDKD